jgi:hypothetical protein
MSLADDVKAPIRHADRFFIDGQWVQPSSDATIKVIDSGTEELFFSVAEAQAADISRAVEALVVNAKRFEDAEGVEVVPPVDDLAILDGDD